MTQLKINQNSYKIGIDEIKGLKPLLMALLKPVQDKVKESVYWNDCDLEETEYKSRDGFIPYHENCGGIEISLTIPKCESYDFSILEFGECAECNAATDGKQCGYRGEECASESEGHLDAKLRIWLKFEGLDADGNMQFWLYMGGGNGDAPYFRAKYEATVFEESFSAKTLAQAKTKGQAAVKRLLKVLK